MHMVVFKKQFNVERQNMQWYTYMETTQINKVKCVLYLKQLQCVFIHSCVLQFKKSYNFIFSKDTTDTLKYSIN